MQATAENILQQSVAGKIKIILTQLLFGSDTKGDYVVHYIEKDEEPISYKHTLKPHAVADYNYLAKIAKKETGGKHS